jgi:hypothetical protein
MSNKPISPLRQRMIDDDLDFKPLVTALVEMGLDVQLHASATNHNAWRRRMRKPRQEGASSIGSEAEARGPARGLSRKSSREASSNLVGGRRIRCAIYTRKS